MIHKKVFRSAVVASVFTCAVGSFGFSTTQAYANPLASALNGSEEETVTSIPSVTTQTIYATPLAMGMAHSESAGWQTQQVGTVTLGSETDGAAIDSFMLQVGYETSTGAEAIVTGDISYRVNDGEQWSDWVANGAVAGSADTGSPIYAVQIALSGDLAEKYDVRYRAYVANVGWLEWTSDGASAGTEGLDLPIQALQVEYVSHDDSVDETVQDGAYLAMPQLDTAYTTDGVEWVAAEEGVAGDVEGDGVFSLAAGVSGDNVPSGSVTVGAKASDDDDWTVLSRDGAAYAGAQATQVEITLDGQLDAACDIQYRAYVEGLGWLGWTSDGEAAGCTNYDGVVKAVEVRLVPEGAELPESDDDALYDGTVTAVWAEGTATSSIDLSSEELTETGAAIVKAAKETEFAGEGWCARWVSLVYQNAGLGYPGGNACDMYYAYCTSSDLADLKPGMIVATPAHTWTEAGRVYGHVGVYIGGGMVMDNVSYLRTISLDQWISDYSMLYEVKWGWAY